MNKQTQNSTTCILTGERIGVDQYLRTAAGIGVLEKEREVEFRGSSCGGECCGQQHHHHSTQKSCPSLAFFLIPVLHHLQCHQNLLKLVNIYSGGLFVLVLLVFETSFQFNSKPHRAEERQRPGCAPTLNEVNWVD